MDSEVIPSRKKLKKKPVLKTLKLRLFPTEEEKEQLNTCFNQFRWYYNCILTVVYNHYGYDKILDKRKYSTYTVRDLFRKYEYTEEIKGNLVFKDFIYNEDTIDETEKSYLLWKKAKNLISELHWKTISFLMENKGSVIAAIETWQTIIVLK